MYFLLVQEQSETMQMMVSEGLDRGASGVRSHDECFGFYAGRGSMRASKVGGTKDEDRLGASHNRR